VRWADSIVVLDQGRVVERGTHEELVRRRGIYADLWWKSGLEEAPAESHDWRAMLDGVLDAVAQPAQRTRAKRDDDLVGATDG
jgi:ABC-type glutathione transport system ATPase component